MISVYRKKIKLYAVKSVTVKHAYTCIQTNVKRFDGGPTLSLILECGGVGRVLVRQMAGFCGEGFHNSSS